MLARLEAKLALEILLRRFTKLTLQDPVVKWTETYIVRGPQKLPVWFETASAQER
jgi:cytochrome P450